MNSSEMWSNNLYFRFFNSKWDIHINFKILSYLLYSNILSLEIKIKVCKIYTTFPLLFANIPCYIGEFYGKKTEIYNLTFHQKNISNRCLQAKIFKTVVSCWFKLDPS